jgi:sortase A
MKPNIPIVHRVQRLLSASVRVAEPESYLLLIGIGLLGIYSGASLHSFLFSNIALGEFNLAQMSAVTDKGSDPSGGQVDFSLWGKARIKAYRASSALKLDPPIAVLRIRNIHLTAPVFDGTDEMILNRGVGRIEGTAMPGSDGNLAIAGHRDGFFRGLKDIQPGDLVEVDTLEERDTYIVDATTIVNPKDVSVLEARTLPSVTLVTCYPFYFIGDAPQRFIVKASLMDRDLLQQTPRSESQ